MSEEFEQSKGLIGVVEFSRVLQRGSHMGKKIERFEDLIAWQKSRALTARVYRMTRQPRIARDFGFSGQVQRASVSTMSNLAEGFERRGPGEFRQQVSTSKGSAAEVRSLLYVALDVGYITPVQFNSMMADAEEVSRVTGGLLASLDRARNAGESRRRP